jgi:signal transduction histidine kinase
MAKENKVRIFNRLFFKLYLNYAVMLLVTAVLIGLIFMKLYENTTMKDNEEELISQAETISNRMTEFIKSKRYNDFLDYYNTLNEITGLDIWTISNPNAPDPMDENMETTSYDELTNTQDDVNTKEYVELVQSAFHNRPDKRTSYDTLYGVPTITVAEPVYGLNREVVGAVLLKLEVDSQKKIIASSVNLIVISCVVALGISFIIIIVFATELSLPISRMRKTALELAAANYHSKTGITRNDELGDLAKTVDILSEKLLENDIQRKNLDQMRLDFFANVSHELRTPITVLRAYTETLVDGVVKDPEKVTQYYERMLSECKSMERLVGDLLLLSKMQNPDFLIEKEPVNLVQVFDNIFRSANAIAEKKNIAIEVIKDAPDYMILGDYERLRQMFMIILDNAIKFSEENKTVHINLSKSDKIKVSIRDEGIGIAEADINNIFEKFYKSNLKQNASGTGLGLAIAKQIAFKHEGTIGVKSTLGVGTEFSFTFEPYLMDF